MSEVTFDTSELSALAAEFVKAGVLAPKVVDKIVGATAREVRDDMRSSAPRDSGELVGSIRVRAAGRGAREVRAEARHAVFVEYGTSVMPPQPFVGPAADRADRLLADRVLAAAVKALDV